MTASILKWKVVGQIRTRELTGCAVEESSYSICRNEQTRSTILAKYAPDVYSLLPLVVVRGLTIPAIHRTIELQIVLDTLSIYLYVKMLVPWHLEASSSEQGVDADHHIREMEVIV